MRKLTILYLVLFMAFSAFSLTPLNARAEGDVPVFKVGHVGHDHQIALFVAALEGDKYKEHGVWLKEKKKKEVYGLISKGTEIAELHLLKVGGGSRMPAAMERGEIQIGFGGVAAVAFFRDKGDPFKIICPLQTEGDMLVVKKDLPVEDWDSFIKYLRKRDKPVRIGYKAPVAVAKLIFMAALDEEGISHTTSEKKEEGAKVELVNLQGGKNMMPSLSAGTVDGFVMNQPQVSLAKIKGVGKVVADLAHLPPKGNWIDHPCCCVATTDEMIGKHRSELKQFMRLIYVATHEINSDKEMAAKLTSEWTKLPIEVENDSLPTIEYVAEFRESWKKGMFVWRRIMDDLGKFKKELKDKEDDEFWKLLVDETIMNEAVEEYKAEREDEEEE
ncbi:MAG: ABC transporter substrate-binding protein [Planctomycetota bacterium]|nr:ABC transporter substrate-binding protein [Planctomycetota bacterium]